MAIAIIAISVIILGFYKVAHAFVETEMETMTSTKMAEEHVIRGVNASQTNVIPKADTNYNSAIRLALIKEFGSEHIMLHIASCESRYRQFDKDGSVLRGRVNPKDVGVFQINEYYHLTTAQKLGIDIYSLQGNIKYAKILYDRNGTRDWKASQPGWSKGECVS